jgi:hypothetical protein
MQILSNLNAPATSTNNLLYQGPCGLASLSSDTSCLTRLTLSALRLALWRPWDPKPCERALAGLVGSDDSVISFDDWHRWRLSGFSAEN